MLDLTKPVLVVDLETNNLDGDIIWCVGWCNEAGESGVMTPEELTNELLETYTLIFHNAAFDVKVLRKHGYYVPSASYYDTLVMSYVWEPGLEGGHSLEAWGERLGFPKGEHNDWSQLSDEMRTYCKRDCELTMGLFLHLREKLLHDVKAWDLLRQVELPFIEVILEMECNGFYFDNTTAESLLTQWSASRHALEQDNLSSILVPGKEKLYAKGLFKRSGVVMYDHCTLEEFNANSGNHKQWLLYEKHKLKVPKYTKSGQPSTDDESLSLLAEKLPIAKTLSEIATYTKHIGMVQGYRERLDGRKLCGSFNQCITLTGRLSSTNPNLQNIPTRGDMGQEIRKLFYAPEDTGLSIVGIDLSNIEGRVLAHYLSKVEGDTRMADTFAAGVDFHQANADAWQVTRNEAKTLLYACLYGAGDIKLGNGDKQRGKELRDKLDKNMPALQRLKEKVWATCKQRGYIYTAFGRRLVYRGMQSADRGEVARAQRQVFNAMLQGTAADVLKILVLGALQDINKSWVDAWLIANVHDEALFYCYTEDAEDLCYILNHRFKQPLLSHCPIEGTAKVGKTWYDVH
jgi:DNA polymerase-1